MQRPADYEDDVAYYWREGDEVKVTLVVRLKTPARKVEFSVRHWPDIQLTRGVNTTFVYSVDDSQPPVNLHFTEDNRVLVQPGFQLTEDGFTELAIVPIKAIVIVHLLQQ